jgi:hypothetical protein
VGRPTHLLIPSDIIGIRFGTVNEAPRMRRHRQTLSHGMREEEAGMKWVTREHPHTDRIACPWLIRNFIDPDAEIVYVHRDDVLAYAEREGAISFDAPGSKFTHRDGLCSFEVLIEEHGLGGDAALALVARVVHGADISEDAEATPESRGLEAIARGFMLLGLDDQEQLRLELPVYDALYAWAKREVAGG